MPSKSTRNICQTSPMHNKGCGVCGFMPCYHKNFRDDTSTTIEQPKEDIEKSTSDNDQELMALTDEIINEVSLTKKKKILLIIEFLRVNVENCFTQLDLFSKKPSFFQYQTFSKAKYTFLRFKRKN